MKSSRKIGKERFLYLCNAIGLLNSIIHKGFENEEFSSLPYIHDDEGLTKNICELVEYVRRFEEKSGLRLEVNIDLDDEEGVSYD